MQALYGVSYQASVVTRFKQRVYITEHKHMNTSQVQMELKIMASSQPLNNISEEDRILEAHCIVNGNI